MLDRIRRAVALTRARHASKGRHRRRLTRARPPAASVSSAPVDRPTVGLGLLRDRTTGHRYLLRGEDIALVHPYVLAWEERVRRRAMDAAATDTPARARSVLAGVG